MKVQRIKNPFFTVYEVFLNPLEKVHEKVYNIQNPVVKKL
jgi:hypothetical protein